MPRKARGEVSGEARESVDGVKLVEARVSAADRLLSVRTKLLNLGIGGRNPDQEEYLIATLVGIGAGALSVWPEVVKTLEKAEKMDWDRAVAVAPADGRVKSITVKNFGSFENLYAELVEPWLGPWAQLRETYARYRKGEISREQGREEIAAARMMAAPAEVGPGQGHRSDLKPRDDVTKSDRGNSADYLAARLKRDHPDIAERVERGGYRSIRAAAIEAGIVKKPNAYKQLCRAWNKATPEERDRFEEYIGEWRRRKDAA